MSHIVLTDEQALVLNKATAPVEVRNTSGHLVGLIAAPSEEEIIARALRSRQENRPRYPAEEVHARLMRLQEIAEREPLDSAKVKDLLRRMRAGEEV